MERLLDSAALHDNTLKSVKLEALGTLPDTLEAVLALDVATGAFFDASTIDGVANTADLVVFVKEC